MARAEKDSFIQEMQSSLDKASGVLFVDFTGLTVAEAETVRKKFRGAGVTYRVVKNSLMKRALAGKPYEGAAGVLKGTPTGVVLGFEDPVSAARLTFELKKDIEHIKVKGGIADKKALNASEAEALSKMPSKRELQGQLIGLFLSPGRKLAGQIKNVGGMLLSQIDKRISNLEQQG